MRNAVAPALQRRRNRRAGGVGRPGEFPARGSMRASDCGARALPRSARSRCSLTPTVSRPSTDAEVSRPSTDADASCFEEWRGLLFGIAYRMLGSATDAEGHGPRGVSAVGTTVGPRGGVGARLSGDDRDPAVPRSPRLGSGTAGLLCGPVVARADHDRPAGSGGAGGFSEHGLPGPPRRAHPPGTGRVLVARRLRLPLRRGGPLHWSLRRRLPPAGVTSPAPHRRTSSALRRRPSARPGADQEVRDGLRQRRPGRSVGVVGRRRGGVDRRGWQGAGRHAPRHRGTAVLTFLAQRRQEGARRARGRSH